MRKFTALAFAMLAAGCATQNQSAAELAGDACRPLDTATLGLDGAHQRWVPATEGLPGFCEVSGMLHPVTGSNIGVVYRLPAEWNGKVLGIGGGGWAGNVKLSEAADGLRKGYATLQTDGGHPGTGSWENSWASNSEAAKDFSWRAVHETAVTGRKLAAAYYGKAPRRAYFYGCSTGGRMALMEAQRFPGDFDGIVAGAPVYTLQVQASAVKRNNVFAADGGAAGFSDKDLALVQDAVLAQCDMDDGLEDGFVGNPRQCSWDPGTIQCTGEKQSNCLAAPQVTALRTIYSGIKSPDGQYAMLPMSRGGEKGWPPYVGTTGNNTDPTGGGGLVTLWATLFPDHSADFTALDPAVDVPFLRTSPFAEMYEAKDPELGDFFSRGGKLLMWHGESDPGPSPIATADYVAKVSRANPAAGSQLRYFALPGVEHCKRGPGAYEVDWIDTLDKWVETGQAPERVVGTKPGEKLTRPHCAWPGMARYSGSGDASDLANWQCVAR